MSAYLNFVSVGVLDVWPFTALHELNEASWELRCRNYSESASTPPPTVLSPWAKMRVDHGGSAVN